MEPRIGVFICHCGSNIASTVDVEEVTLRSESHTCLIEHVVAAADGAVFVFVLWETK